MYASLGTIMKTLAQWKPFPLAARILSHVQLNAKLQLKYVRTDEMANTQLLKCSPRKLPTLAQFGVYYSASLNVDIEPGNHYHQAGTLSTPVNVKAVLLGCLVEMIQMNSRLCRRIYKLLQNKQTNIHTHIYIPYQLELLNYIHTYFKIN